MGTAFRSSLLCTPSRQPPSGRWTTNLDEDVLVCGDVRAAKEVVRELVSRNAGLRCVDAGRLEMSRVVEQLTALLISINVRHKVHARIKTTGLT